MGLTIISIILLVFCCYAVYARCMAKNTKKIREFCKTGRHGFICAYGQDRDYGVVKGYNHKTNFVEVKTLGGKIIKVPLYDIYY